MTVRLDVDRANQWVLCPGSVHLYNDFNISQKVTREMKENDLAHEVLNIGLKYIQEHNSVPGNDIFPQRNLPEDMLSNVRVAIREVLQILTSTNNQTVLIVNNMYSMAWTGVHEMSGSNPDAVIIERDDERIVKIHIIDYDHTNIIQVAPENDNKIKLCAMGVIKEYNVSGNPAIDLVSIQPRHWCRDAIVTVNTNLCDVEEWFRSTMQYNIDVALVNENSFSPGPTQCHKCSAATKCPALREEYEWLANTGDVNAMNTEDKVRALQNAPQVIKFLNDLKDEAVSQIENGSREYEDYMTINVRAGRRRITPEGEENLEAMLGSEAFRQVPKTFTQIKSILFHRKNMSDEASNEFLTKISERGEKTRSLNFYTQED